MDILLKIHKWIDEEYYSEIKKGHTEEDDWYCNRAISQSTFVDIFEY